MEAIKIGARVGFEKIEDMEKCFEKIDFPFELALPWRYKDLWLPMENRLQEAFNGLDWGPVYLIMFSIQNGVLSPVRRYDNDQNNIPGWKMQRRDQFWTANFDGSGLQTLFAFGDSYDDLVVYNSQNWSTQYLGMLRSDGSSLSGSWQKDWIGGWNLGTYDSFHVAEFRGTGDWDDLFIFNKNWFGLLRSFANRYELEALDPKWIHNHRYHAYGWW